MNETALRTLLNDVAAETPQRTAVDSYLAVETARRQRRLRQRLVAIGAAALVLLVTVATAVVAVAVRDRPAPPVTPRQAPTSFDPLKLRVTPGWLPGGYIPTQTRITASDIRITYSSADHQGVITVYLAPRKRIVVEPVLAPASVPGAAIPRTVPPGAPGPDVNGEPSSWYPEGSRMNGGGPAGRVGQLRFQWAPDAIGLVDIGGLTDPQDVAVRVAKALKVQPGTPTPLPYSLAEPLPHPVFELITGEIGSPLAWVHVQYGTSYQDVKAQVDYATSKTDNTTVNRPRPVGTWRAEVTRVDKTTTEVRFAPSIDTRASIQAAHADALRIAAGFRVTGKLQDQTTWK
ncbi:hypothetical protein [Cryptosporangium aurantiacum]|uniref:Uncharacterized protein n=1 Tax=Cryptosporangium aurantiacum TaxID=134849 RepID=A0A1M7N4U0_9ACTN|nr:hypothetical protein [Cryptosporangium aurantiacum]SHM98591.1 hypothetical protein SAMN05443668_102423 [Cryptosporangium aurantiacum]